MKSEKIKQKIQQTKEKRKSQIPTIIQCKLQNLSKRKIQMLERLFLEAKWLYNWLIADISRVNLSTKEIKEVEIKVGENLEKRELTIIGSQIKQGIPLDWRDVMPPQGEAPHFSEERKSRI